MRGDPALLLQPQERRVDGALVQPEHVFAHLSMRRATPNPCRGPIACSVLQDHQVERALQHVGLAHSFGHCKEA